MRCDLNPDFRFLRKSQNENERRLFQNYWKEYTNLYGTYVDYFTYEYRVSAHDFFYGEHPVAPYASPKGMVILAEFQNDSLILSKFGIQTEADVVFVIPIMSYYEQFGFGTEPKAGDLIRLTELGWDRPGGMDDINVPTTAPVSACDDFTDPLDLLCSDGIVEQPIPNCFTDTNAYSGYNDTETFNQLIRGAPVFEITERRDENMTMPYNTLQGHYIWILHAKRFDYNYAPNAPREPGGDQVTDDTLYGKLSGGTNYPEGPKQYNQNIKDESDTEWNYTDHPQDNTTVYGEY